MAVKFRQSGVVRDVLAAGRAAAVYLADVQYDFPAFVFDRQRPGNSQSVSVGSRLDLRALKTNFRIAIRLKEIRRAQVCVTSLVACFNARRVAARLLLTSGGCRLRQEQWSPRES